MLTLDRMLLRGENSQAFFFFCVFFIFLFTKTPPLGLLYLPVGSIYFGQGCPAQVLALFRTKQFFQKSPSAEKNNLKPLCCSVALPPALVKLVQQLAFVLFFRGVHFVKAHCFRGFHKDETCLFLFH